MTPNDIIKIALKQVGIVGVGQTPMAEDVNDAFALLNMMLGQWNRRRWLVFHLMETALVSTGQQTYSVGPGGDFNVPRTTNIDAAFIRILSNPAPQQIDFPLQIVESYEDWSLVPNKGQTGFPQLVFLDTGNPLSTLHVWQIPTAGLYEIHLVIKAALTGFATLADTVTLPAEYQEAILYNLAVRLRPAYQLPPEPSLTALARASLETVRKANVQLPLLEMPDNLNAVLDRGAFNIYRGY